MKAELMALALLFAALGFINSHASTGSDDRAVQMIGDLTGNSYQPWINPSWQPSREVQILLFGLQAAIGFVMLAYFMRHRKDEKSIDPDWD